MIGIGTAGILLILGLASAYLLLFRKTRGKNLPPGPYGFPIIGHLPLLGKAPFKTLKEWTESKRFGPVISINFGSFPTIAINDWKLIKDALADPIFAGRPDIKIFKDRSGGSVKGIIFTDGEHWLEQRRFTLRHLRDFGFGKKSMESIILVEVTELINRFLKDVGKPISTRNAFNAAILNALWSLLTGDRFEQDDPELAHIINLLTTNIEENNFMKAISTFIPWIADTFPNLSGYNKAMESLKPTLEFLQKPVTQHQNTFVEGELRDFLDTYINETKNTTDPNSSFHESKTDILFVMLDLFIAGSETTSTALSWAFLYLAKFQEIQKKLHNEIDLVVGKSRLPSINDKPSMLYTQAVMQEILRYSTIAPFGLFHNTTKEVQLAGYTIPKDTMVLPNLYAASFDKEAWGDPEAFRPERFIGDDGKLVKNEAFLVFGTGKRVCLGETLARDEMFLFMTSLFQRFVVTSELEPSELDLDPIVGGVLVPKPYKFILKDRQ